jgi:hypothetical protein
LQATTAICPAIDPPETDHADIGRLKWWISEASD